MTASLGANERHDASQECAVAAAQAGFDGIRYLVRHGPAQKLYGVALFGSQDAHEWERDRAHVIPEQLIVEARRPFGYRVLPTP